MIIFKSLRALLYLLLILIGAAAATLALFLLLPIIQDIGKTEQKQKKFVEAGMVDDPPEMEDVEEEEPDEPEEEPEPPQLNELDQPLDLSQLELALNQGGVGGGWMRSDLAAQLNNLAGGDANGDEGISFEVDQKPRAVYQPSPQLNAALREKAPATVYVLFVVNKAGRVENPIVQRSTDPSFERSAVSAVRKWKFEPGKRGGRAVSYRMRVPITFPKSS